MTETTMHSDFPDPIRQAAFYEGVPTKRAMAWVIDTLIILGLVLVMLPFTLFTALFFLVPLYALVSFVYRVVTLSMGSATLGMRLMAIEFRRQDGRRFDLGTAFLHTLGYTISMSMILLQVVSVGLILTSARGQGLTDHVLGTTALNTRR